MAYITDENGNYKRTVRCGHCYEKGHNKGSCPKRKQDLKTNIEAYNKQLAEDKFRNSYDRECIERYLMRSKEQLHKMETKGQNRKCGYCSEPGHTRRTCTARKSEVQRITDETIDFRKRVAERMVHDGFGIGALVEVATRYGQDPRMAMITSINFKDLSTNFKVSKENYFNGYNGLSFQYLVPFEDNYGYTYTDGHCYLDCHYANVDDIPESEWYRNPTNSVPKLLSGVDVSEDSLLAEETIDWKTVSKWVADTIVDPK